MKRDKQHPTGEHLWTVGGACLVCGAPMPVEEQVRLLTLDRERYRGKRHADRVGFI